MKIYKFGGASVKNAQSVKNLFKILKTLGTEDTLIVISAMGKMTNAFEKIVATYFYDKKKVNTEINAVIDFHNNIIQELFLNPKHRIYSEFNEIINSLHSFILQNTSKDYNYIYDQIVGNAELISTKICSCYLNDQGMANTWIDVRLCIRTNSEFRRAKIDWEKTCTQITEKISKTNLYITQGFIGSDNKNNTTTIGREGSDYTAGIFAYCLNADSVSIFKDVPGVLNADPRVFDKTVLLNQISYKEAIEMAFYGASVIHPKTIQPLQKKNIPLFVQSFINPLEKGTSIGIDDNIIPKIPCFIVKNNQILLSISDKEFTFIMEDDISKIFDYLHQYRIKVNLIQNSAISFSVCIEDNFNNFNFLLDKLKSKYKILYNKNLTLYTIRHFKEKDIDEIEYKKRVYLKQLSRETAQLIVKTEYS